MQLSKIYVYDNNTVPYCIQISFNAIQYIDYYINRLEFKGGRSNTLLSFV